jgi:hypothetical protein
MAKIKQALHGGNGRSSSGKGEGMTEKALGKIKEGTKGSTESQSGSSSAQGPLQRLRESLR